MDVIYLDCVELLVSAVGALGECFVRIILV
jgi:hypothetical protein